MTIPAPVSNVLKVAAAGATIAVVAFAVATLGPRAEVAETRADVVDFAFFDTTPSARFVRALEHLGHEPPRAYLMGEETVYFSARSTTRTPAELVEEYQRTFVEQGVNARVHLEPTAPFSDDARDMLRGEVLTFSANDALMSMGGGVIAGLPETASELSHALEKHRTDDFADVFRGFRTVRAERADGLTVVTAVWSDDDFDIREALSAGSPSLDVPACPGCVAMPGFQTLANDVDRTIHHFESPQSTADVQQFYQRALAGRGWVETTSSRHVASDRREYSRANDRLVILTGSQAHGTSVSVIQGR